MSNYQIYRTLSGINKPKKSLNQISLHQTHINNKRYFRKGGIVFLATTSLLSLGIIYFNKSIECKPQN